MTEDRAFNIFLIVFFGMAGIAVLILTWTRPMPVSERILATFAGAIGLLVALIWMRVFSSVRIRTGAEPVPVEAHADKS